MVHIPVLLVHSPVQHGQWPGIISSMTRQIMIHGMVERVHCPVAYGTQPCISWSMALYNIYSDSVSHGPRFGSSCYKRLVPHGGHTGTICSRTWQLMSHGLVERVYCPVAHSAQPGTTWSMAQYNMVHSLVTHCPRLGTTYHGLVSHCIQTLTHSRWPNTTWYMAQ